MTQKRYTEIPKRQKCINKEEPYIGGAKDILDDELNKPQSQINDETNQRVSTLEESVGTGGSVDERIAVEKNRAEQAEGVLDGKVATEKQRAEGVEGGLNTRLQTVEELATISVGGGDIGIGTAADFESDDPEDLAKVPTVGAMLGGANDGVYDISARHSGATYADLSAALGTNGANIPVSLRKGGMSVKFVHTSDNKYVQYRYILDVSTAVQFANPINWQVYANVEDFVKKSSSSTSIADETNALYITDENGNAIAKFDDDGLHINNMNSNRSKYIVCDEAGNIAFRIRKNGESDIILSQESFLAALNKTSNYKDDSFSVDIPEELFRVTNDIYSKREYAPRLFAERLQETDNELTFENGSPEWYVARKTLDMFSNLFKTDSVSRQVFVDMYRRKNISFNLHTTKASVFYEKTLNFLPIGDSITAQNNWHTYLRKLLLMDNVDWQIANSSDANKYGLQTIGINRSTSNTSFTYRNKNVNVHYNYNEGRSSWAAATYLRHADLYTWAAVSYNGSSKSILHVAWRVLGLYEKYNVEYSGTAQQREYIRTTCNGQYSITSACIDGYVWNNYRSKIGYDSVDYSNATSTQKDEMVTYLTSTLLDNPVNPFFSKTKVLETKDSDNCYAFDWDTYYARYKTHNESGEELETKGTYATSSMHVCVPNIVGICLGTNDSVWGSEDTMVNMQDAYKIAELLSDSIGAAVIIFANGVPQSSHVANYRLAGSQYDYSSARYYQLKNQKLRELCGDFTNQMTKNVFYCPCYYVQCFGNCNDNPLTEIYTENSIGSVLTMDDIHPSAEATSQWSYEVYSLIAYLIAKNIIN